LLELGFGLAGERALRADVLETLLAALEQAALAAPFQLPEAIEQRLDCSHEEAAALVRALGYAEDASGLFAPMRKRRRRRRSARKKPPNGGTRHGDSSSDR
jgi:hypothetical protein